MIAEQYLLMIGCLLAAAAALRPAPDHLAAAGGAAGARLGGQRIQAPHLTRWDVTGRVAEELTAERLDYTGAADSALLARPALRIGTEAGEVWDVTAATASVPTPGKRIEFDGRVEAAARPGAGAGALRLQTEHLALDPVLKQAWSDRPVHLHSRHGDIDGLGLEADLASGRLRLLKQVRGAHERQTD